MPLRPWTTQYTLIDQSLPVFIEKISCPNSGAQFWDDHSLKLANVGREQSNAFCKLLRRHGVLIQSKPESSLADVDSLPDVRIVIGVKLSFHFIIWRLQLIQVGWSDRQLIAASQGQNLFLVTKRRPHYNRGALELLKVRVNVLHG